MNIEESIEYLKLKIKNDNLTIQGMFGDIYEEIQKDNEAIETLLTAYEKEKGENVKLRLQDIPLIEGELKAYKDRVNELKAELEKEKEKNKKINKYIEDRAKIGKDIQTFINKDYVEQEYISKDKIKAKIEELKERPNKMVIDKEIPEEYKNIFLDENAILVLQSLLEKE